jgi:hypothetical protein
MPGILMPQPPRRGWMSRWSAEAFDLVLRTPLAWLAVAATCLLAPVVLSFHISTPMVPAAVADAILWAAAATLFLVFGARAASRADGVRPGSLRSSLVHLLLPCALVAGGVSFVSSLVGSAGVQGLGALVATAAAGSAAAAGFTGRTLAPALMAYGIDPDRACGASRDALSGPARTPAFFLLAAGIQPALVAALVPVSSAGGPWLALAVAAAALLAACWSSALCFVAAREIFFGVVQNSTQRPAPTIGAPVRAGA